MTVFTLVSAHMGRDLGSSEIRTQWIGRRGRVPIVWDGIKGRGDTRVQWIGRRGRVPVIRDGIWGRGDIRSQWIDRRGRHGMFVFAGLVFTSLSINIHMPILHTVRYTLPVALERRISGDLYQFALHFAPVQLLKQYLDHPSTPLPLKPNKYTKKKLTWLCFEHHIIDFVSSCSLFCVLFLNNCLFARQWHMAIRDGHCGKPWNVTWR